MKWKSCTVFRDLCNRHCNWPYFVRGYTCTTAAVVVEHCSPATRLPPVEQSLYCWWQTLFVVTLRWSMINIWQSCSPGISWKSIHFIFQDSHYQCSPSKGHIHNIYYVYIHSSSDTLFVWQYTYIIIHTTYLKIYIYILYILDQHYGFMIPIAPMEWVFGRAFSGRFRLSWRSLRRRSRWCHWAVYGGLGVKAIETPSPTALGDVLIYGKSMASHSIFLNGNRTGSGGEIGIYHLQLWRWKLRIWEMGF